MATVGFTDVTFAGRTFRVDAANGMDQVADQMRNGSYEPPLPLLMMATLLRTEGSFVDVGANTGLYSVVAGVLAPDRKIMSFEPHPTVAAACLRNLQANDLIERVQLHQVALSDSAGVLDLYMPDQGHGLIETSASLERDFQKVASSISVEVKRLDDFEINAPIAVIKVDIEGHEYAFLRGAEKLIQRDRPIIFLEILHGAKRHLLGQFLRDTGYIDFRLRADMAIHDGEVQFDPAAWNHAFVPAERTMRFKEACDSCSLPMLRRFQLV